VEGKTKKPKGTREMIDDACVSRRAFRGGTADDEFLFVTSWRRHGTSRSGGPFGRHPSEATPRAHSGYIAASFGNNLEGASPKDDARRYARAIAFMERATSANRARSARELHALIGTKRARERLTCAGRSAEFLAWGHARDWKKRRADLPALPPPIFFFVSLRGGGARARRVRDRRAHVPHRAMLGRAGAKNVTRDFSARSSSPPRRSGAPDALRFFSRSRPPGAGHRTTTLRARGTTARRFLVLISPTQEHRCASSHLKGPLATHDQFGRILARETGSRGPPGRALARRARDAVSEAVLTRTWLRIPPPLSRERSGKRGASPRRAAPPEFGVPRFVVPRFDRFQRKKMVKALQIGKRGYSERHSWSPPPHLGEHDHRDAGRTGRAEAFVGPQSSEGRFGLRLEIEFVDSRAPTARVAQWRPIAFSIASAGVLICASNTRPGARAEGRKPLSSRPPPLYSHLSSSIFPLEAHNRSGAAGGDAADS